MASLQVHVPAQLCWMEIPEFLRANCLFPTDRVTEIIIDGSSSTWTEPAAIAIIAGACAHHFPTVPDTRPAIIVALGDNLGYWQRMEFFTILGIPSEEDFTRYDPEARFFPMQIVKGLSGVENASQSIARVVTTDQDESLYVQIIIQELLGNAIHHAEWPRGAIVTAQYFSTTDRVQLAIVDCGMGIMQSLLQNPDCRPQDHQEALHLSLQPWVSGKGGLSRLDREAYGHVGCGMAVAAGLVRRTDGNMLIISGDASLSVQGKRAVSINHWPGTIVIIELYRNRLKAYNQSMKEIRNELGPRPRDRGRLRFV